MSRPQLELAPELAWLWSGIALYLAAALWSLVWPRPAAVAGRAGSSSPESPAGLWWLLAAGVVLFGTGLAHRWMRLGHGPFVNMFEILASSLFSLGLVYAIACRFVPVAAQAIRIVLPVLGTMALWLAVTSPNDTRLPVTYDTPVLWFHVLLGKLFLGCAFAALGLAGVVLLRATHAGAVRLAALPVDETLDAAAWRLMGVALVFESLMLIAGAVWAQDAWGRWWDWDPLEVWAFATWLLLVAAIHARRTWAIRPRLAAAMIVVVFVVAFLTFFGVPFVSVAPHKGAV